MWPQGGFFPIIYYREKAFLHGGVKKGFNDGVLV
jgi:hypothetical protein